MTISNEIINKKWVLNKKRIQPRGKQSPHQHSWGCYYTRTTGIWQTVWLEAVNKDNIKNITNFYSSSKSLINKNDFSFTGDLDKEVVIYFGVGTTHTSPAAKNARGMLNIILTTR